MSGGGQDRMESENSRGYVLLIFDLMRGQNWPWKIGVTIA